MIKSPGTIFKKTDTQVFSLEILNIYHQTAEFLAILTSLGDSYYYQIWKVDLNHTSGSVSGKNQMIDQKMTGQEYCMEKEKGNAVFAQDELNHCGRTSQKHC